jgi:hypothetical protein
VDKKEFSIFASALRTYYPREKLLPNEQAMELWYNQLKDIPYKVAEASLNKWVATEKWSPSIADIRQTATEMVSTTSYDWGDGWEQVDKAIKKYGMYNEAEALESMDAITRQAVQRLGFKNICTSDNYQADRANFRMIYEKLAEREKKENQVPASLKALINTMPNTNLIGGGNE